jgi:hypothetical protein
MLFVMIITIIVTSISFIVMQALCEVPMTPGFRRLDRLFWVVWLTLPLMILETAGISPVDLLRGDWAPASWLTDLVATLPTWGRTLYWIFYFSDFVVYAIGLALGHWVIHRAARGRLFAADIRAAVRLLGWILVIWPLIGLGLNNLINLAFAERPGADPFTPTFIPDVVLFGFGLFLLAIAAALAEAIRLRQDADLTI